MRALSAGRRARVEHALSGCKIEQLRRALRAGILNRDIAFAARQAAILDALWQLLAPGGKLLYVTCSVFPQENQELVQAFVARTERARALPLPHGQRQQWLPAPQHDGFYYALIQKHA